MGITLSLVLSVCQALYPPIFLDFFLLTLDSLLTHVLIMLGWIIKTNPPKISVVLSVQCTSFWYSVQQTVALLISLDFRLCLFSSACPLGSISFLCWAKARKLPQDSKLGQLQSFFHSYPYLRIVDFCCLILSVMSAIFSHFFLFF